MWHTPFLRFSFAGAGTLLLRPIGRLMSKLPGDIDAPCCKAVRVVFVLLVAVL